MVIVDLIQRVCGTIDKLQVTLRGGNVRRYHMEGPAVLPQSVAEHTWRALTLLLYLWPDSSRNCILALHYHDVAESLTGDPSKALKAFPKVAELFAEMEDEFDSHMQLQFHITEEEYLRIKTVDALECWLYCHQQPPSHLLYPLLERAASCMGAVLKELREDEVDRVRRIMRGWTDG